MMTNDYAILLLCLKYDVGSNPCDPVYIYRQYPAVVCMCDT